MKLMSVMKISRSTIIAFFLVNSPILVIEKPQGNFVYENDATDGTLVTELISYNRFANSFLFSIILLMFPLFEFSRRRFLLRKCLAR